MSYTLIKKSSPNCASRGGTTIKEIVIHHWGKKGQSFDGVTNWLCNPKSGVSAHYVVKGRKVAYIVNESKAAYHAGNWSHNLKSIGIECRPEATEEDYRTVAELVADIWERRGKMPLIRHKDIVSTACPGEWNISKIERMAEAILKIGPTPVKNPKGTIDKTSIYNVNRNLSTKECIKAGQAWANKLTGSKYAVDGISGKDTKKLKVKILQWALHSDYGARLSINGILNYKTKKALGNHYVGFGEKQYMVTALEVLLLLNGINPYGVERPGLFGKKCLSSVKKFQSNNGLISDGIAGRKTFLKLVV